MVGSILPTIRWIKLLPRRNQPLEFFEPVEDDVKLILPRRFLLLDHDELLPVRGNVVVGDSRSSSRPRKRECIGPLEDNRGRPRLEDCPRCYSRSRRVVAVKGYLYASIGIRGGVAQTSRSYFHERRAGASACASSYERLVQRLPASRVRILDLACGDGMLLSLIGSNHDAIGLDLSYHELRADR